MSGDDVGMRRARFAVLRGFLDRLFGGQLHRKASEAWNHLVDDGHVKRLGANNVGSLQAMHAYYNRRITGKDDYHFLHYFKEKYVGDNSGLRIASFGAGGGHLERTLFQMGWFPSASIDAFELNPRLVESANAKAAEIGAGQLKYFEADLNQGSFGEGKYDIGVFFHSLHHVENVEGCLAQVKKSLKDNGLLLIVDFVGPNRHQWTDQQASLSDSLLSLLPTRYRVHGKKSIKVAIRRPSAKEVIASDPSEAVRSEDLLPVLKTEFEELELKSLGGSLLNHIFDGIADNFDESSPRDSRLIRVLQDMEQWYEENGFLSPDFVFGVYRKAVMQ
jgi:2-polyprenyl-3-methyl-5-hydroxy-6-metoxy-1,4-benzoquinol methylase